MATSKPTQLFSASLALDAVYKTGLRSFMEYRDLDIEKATHGQFEPMSSASRKLPVCMTYIPLVCISISATFRCSMC